MITELVHTETSDKLRLSGLFSKGDTSKAAIIYVHGYEGDFYTNKFIHPINDAVTAKGHAFLSIQNRGTGIRTEFYSNDGARIIGGDYELIEEAHLDISAWIEFLVEKGYSEFILQGHSLGTHKVVRYLFEGEHKSKVKKLILLAPFDKTWFLTDSAGSQQNLAKQYENCLAKIKAGSGEELAPKGYDSAPHSYANFASWAKNDDLGHMYDFHNEKYEFPILRRINVPVKVIVGSEDAFFYPTDPKNPQKAMDILTTNIPVAEGIIIAGANHGFSGKEDVLAKEVAAFV